MAGYFHRPLRNKYNAKPANGFGSKLENAVHDILLLRQNQKEITDIKRQQSVILQDGCPKEQIKWRVDFSYTRMSDQKLCYVEAKGIETMDYRIKLKLWRRLKPAPLEIYKGTWQRPKLHEVIK